MTAVFGKDVHLYVERSSQWVFSACATSCSKEETAEEILVRQNTTRENSYVGGMKDCTITLDSVITLDELPGFQYKDFVDNVGEVINIKLTYDNSYGDRYAYECAALITGVSDTADVSDFATFNVTMKRSGAPTTSLVLNCLLDSDGNPILDSNGYPIR